MPSFNDYIAARSAPRPNYYLTPNQQRQAEEARQRNVLAEILSNQSTQIANRRNQLANTKTAMEMANFGNEKFDKPIQLQDGSFGQPVYDRQGKFVRFEKMPGYTPKQQRPEDTAKLREARELARMQGLVPGTSEYNKFMVTSMQGSRGSGRATNKYTGYDADAGTALNTETGKIELVPLGPDLARLREQADEEERARRAKADTNRNIDIATKTYLFNEAVDEAQDILGDRFSTPTTGVLGAVMATVPSSDRRRLEGHLTTMKANIGFQTLQAMRDASPTGGALGQVSQMELVQLNAALGSLQPGDYENPKEFAEKLEKIQFAYLAIVGSPDLPIVSTDEEYDALPPGTMFMDRHEVDGQMVHRVLVKE